MMPDILIRSDSSSSIGTGHVMRDLVLAKQFDAKDVLFAAQTLPNDLNHKIIAHGYPLEILATNTVEELITLIKRLAVKMVIIDHYEIDYAFEKRLKEATGVTLFVLDDTYERHLCDILLNHNISADPTRYEGLVPVTAELRCGIKHTLLREEFTLEKTQPTTDASQTDKRRVFIAMGGADHAAHNIEILKALASFDDIQIDIVTTRANAALSDLSAYVADQESVTLHIETPQIARLMNRCDLAIVTPSVTMNEVYYLERPFIAIQTAENQTEMASFLQKEGHTVLKIFDEVKLQSAVKKVLYG